MGGDIHALAPEAHDPAGRSLASSEAVGAPWRARNSGEYREIYDVILPCMGESGSASR